MKKWLVSLLVLVILINLPAKVFAQQNTASGEIKVYVNDTEIIFDVPPILVKNFTMVPVRAVFEALGAKVEWDNFTRTVTITKGIEVRVQPGNRTAMINNVPYLMDVPAVQINGRILVPVRFISEAVGASVDWANETKTVFISEITEQKELGNIQNGGRFAADNNYYFHVLPDGVLVRENIITKQKEKIADNILYDLHIINDWIYCIGKDNGISKVVRMKKDGSEKEIIVDKPVISMQIINGWIYYSETGNQSILYRTKTDGTETSVVIEDGDFSFKNWFVQNGWVYYIDTKENTISRIRIDGSDKTNLTNKLVLNFTTKKTIYGLKLIDKDFLYIVLYENITDIDNAEYPSGLYRIPIKGGEFTKISDKVPLSVNMDDKWLYLAVENYENNYRLIRCKKDGSEVITINEYKKGDIPQNIYLNNSLIFYTVIRGDENPEELLFCMGPYGDNIQQYTWIYGKDYYTVNKILTDVYLAYRSLISFNTVQTSTVEKDSEISSIIYESTVNRTRSLFYKKTVIGNQPLIETWLVQENLYSKKSDETHWDIDRISKADAAKMQKFIFDYIQPTDELCNNLKFEQTEESYILKGTGLFPSLMNSILPFLDLDKDISLEMAELNIKINKQKKYIEELELTVTYNSEINDNGEISQFKNNYHYINSQFNTAYLNIPYSISQSVKAKENADKNYENGIGRFIEGKYEEAIKFFDTAIRLYNKSVNAYLYKGNSLYSLGKYKEAILTYNRYHEINPSDAEIFALIGMCYFKLGDLQKAEEMGKETLKYSQSINAYNLLGNVDSAKEDYRKAEENFRKAIILDNKNYTSHINLVSALYNMGNYTRCIEAVNNSLTYFPKDRELLYLKAQCLINQGKSEQAIKVYEEILSDNPSNDFVTMTYIAREYEKLQNYQKAKEYADRAKAVYPDYSLLKYLIDKLDYNLSATAGQKLVDFIKENYLYFKQNDDINTNFDKILEKGNLITLEDVRNLIDAIKKDDDNLTDILSGYEYELFISPENGNSISARQDESYVYVGMKNLYPGTGVKFAEFIQSIENPEEKVLIIDLRDNNRGLPEEANRILDVLLPECNPSYIIDRDGYVRTYTSGKWHTSFKKIGVLVNGTTAGSAELLTLGLKTFANNITIIGNTTAGRGVGQVVYLDRANKFAVFLVNHYWNILQQNIEGKGLVADIAAVENDGDYSKAINKFLEN